MAATPSMSARCLTTPTTTIVGDEKRVLGEKSVSNHKTGCFRTSKRECGMGSSCLCAHQVSKSIEIEKRVGGVCHTKQAGGRIRKENCRIEEMQSLVERLVELSNATTGADWTVRGTPGTVHVGLDHLECFSRGGCGPVKCPRLEVIFA